MACCLAGAQPLSEPMPEYHQLDTWATSVKQLYIFILENVFESVAWKIMAIVFQPQCATFDGLIYFEETKIYIFIMNNSS